MLPDRVSNPGAPTYESGALPIALRRPALVNGSIVAYKYCAICKYLFSLKLKTYVFTTSAQCWGGRVAHWFWVSFQCRGVLLFWIRVGQGPTVFAVGAGGCCLDIFTLVYYFSFLSPSLWETARYRLKHCLEGPLSPKQPTNKPTLMQSRLSVIVIPKFLAD